MATNILGISAYYHDSAAALCIDGDIIAAAHEERFTRIKHDPSFPLHAAQFVLQEAGLRFNDLSAISFYDKPFLTFERLLETYHAFAPRGLRSFLSSVPVWIKEKLFMKQLLRKELQKLGSTNIPILFPEHHASHAASAFYPSPFKEAAILTVDGVGEWATTTIGYGKEHSLSVLKEQHFPHSVGLLYSAVTYYCGFRVNSGEYKLMGLAPYGNPEDSQTQGCIEKILRELVDIREDGSLLLNMSYFDFATGLTMTNRKKWEQLFSIPPRPPESEISQPYMNMAYAIQRVTEKILIKLVHTARELTQSENLVMAGGVALNSVANGKLLTSPIFKNVWIQPAAGDAGGALGAALLGCHVWKGQKRRIIKKPDAMQGALLGPEYDEKRIKGISRTYHAPFDYYKNFDELVVFVAQKLAQGKVIGWFQGKMEFGPRALGNRSILGDARNPEMQKKMNVKIKHREGFRPFAPSVLEEDMEEYFDLNIPSPYMLFVLPLKKVKRKPLPDGYNDLDLYTRLYHLRSDVPAITHIDYSARVQSVNKYTNPRYWSLINEFKRQTGYGIIVNTSFNVRGEPIVCTPDDAFRCFMRTDMDFLVLGNFVFDKTKQEKLLNNQEGRESFTLD